MHDDSNAGMLRAQLLDLPDRKPRMHGAVPLPQNQSCVPDRFWLESTPHFMRVPYDHFVEWNAHLVGRVPAEMLIGQKENFLAALPRPFQRRRGVRRCADDTTTLAAKRFNGRCGVDVSNWNDLSLADNGIRVGASHRSAIVAKADDIRQFAPAHLELLGLGHVRHRTTGRQIRKDHLLVIGAQDISALGHEVHAAEHDELGIRMLSYMTRELVRIAGVISELDHFVALIVMTKNHETSPE